MNPKEFLLLYNIYIKVYIYKYKSTYIIVSYYMFLFLRVYHLKVYHYIAMIIVFILSLTVVYQDTVVIIICSYRTPTNHLHATPLSIPNLVNYFL